MNWCPICNPKEFNKEDEFRRNFFCNKYLAAIGILYLIYELIKWMMTN